MKESILKKITVQTDNRNEFTNKYKRTKGQEPKKSSFMIFVEDKFKRHKTNIPAHPTANCDVESFHWSIEKDCLEWNNETLIKYTTKYMKEYLYTKIKTRGYSLIDKIKETCEIDNIIYPMPQILNM